MWLKKDLPDGRQVQRIFLPKGFDWVKNISPLLSKAGEGPVMWCPATHFGYLESGTMGIKLKESPDTVTTVPPTSEPLAGDTDSTCGTR